MSVVIADDQQIVRDGLVTILGGFDDVEVVGVAVDGNEVVALVESRGVDVVLMDLRMPGTDGVEATRTLAASRPGTRVIVLTTYVDDESILAALQAGAVGYLTKNATAADIHRALLGALAGHAVLDAAVRDRLVEAAHPREPGLPDSLSPREVEVLALVAQGLSNPEIAEWLVVSRSTVKTHINQILRKTGCRDRPQAIVYAHRHGITVGPGPASRA